MSTNLCAPQRIIGFYLNYPQINEIKKFRSHIIFLETVLEHKSVSQSCAVAKSEKFCRGHWTIKLGIQTAGRNKSLVFVLTQFFSFACGAVFSFCLPSLIVQWPARISLLATAHDCETGLFGKLNS